MSPFGPRLWLQERLEFLQTLGTMRVRAALLLVFLLSGFSGLVFEVLWVRLASLGLGITVYAISLVVATFMGGLAFGGWLASRYADRRQWGVRAYAFMELGIAVSGPAVSWLLKSLPAWVSSPPLMMVLAAAAMLVPCTLMGATIPVLCRAVLDPKVPGRAVGWLYGVNTVGAMIGCLAADFWLVPQLGIWNTVMVAAGLNLVAGLVSLSLGQVEAPAARARPSESRRFLSVYWVYAVSGASALGLQGVWVRLLGVAIDARIWVFSLILATFLGCLSLGSWLGSWALGRLAGRARVVLVFLFSAVALSTLLGTLTLIWVEPRLTSPTFSRWLFMLAQPLGPELGWGFVFCLVRALCLFAVPTVCMGLAFPFVCALAMEESGGIGEPVGRLYMMNTLGGIAGSLCSGFVLIPYLGVQHSILLLSFCTLACAAMIGVPSGHKFPKRVFLGGAGLALLTYALLPGNWLISRFHLPVYQRSYGIQAAEVVEFREDLYGTVAVALGTSKGSALLVNGTLMMSSSMPGKRYSRLMAHLPLSLHPAPKKILVICFGLGMTFGAASLHEELESLECVELSPTVLRVAHHFNELNEQVVERQGERIKIHLMDGRNFQLRSQERYDVITFEPPPPLQPGVVNLYSRDYYELCKEHLTPTGLVCQWLPVNQFSEGTARMMVRSFLEVFPDSTVWQGSISDYFIIGGSQPISVDSARLRQLTERLQKPMREIGIENGYDLIACLRQGPLALARYSAGTPAITDDWPYLEYARKLPPVEQLRQLDLSEVKELVKGFGPEDWTQVELRAQAQQALWDFTRLGSPLKDGVSKYLVKYDLARASQGVYSDNVYAADILETSPEKLEALRVASSRGVEQAEDYAFRLLLAKDKSVYAELERLQREFPDRPLAWVLLGLVQRESGQERQARASFEEGLKRISDVEASPILRQALLPGLDATPSPGALP